MLHGPALHAVRVPSRPERWADEDSWIAAFLCLHPAPWYVFEGAAACRCGGTWRYQLAGSAGRPIWRCLHCGGLYYRHRPCG